MSKDIKNKTQSENKSEEKTGFFRKLRKALSRFKEIMVMHFKA